MKFSKNKSADNDAKRALIAKKFEELNGKKAKSLTERPEEDIYTSWYKRAFYIISRSRQSVMGAGYIPLTAITDYANNIEMVEDNVQDFVEIICGMDDIYLSTVNKK